MKLFRRILNNLFRRGLNKSVVGVVAVGVVLVVVGTVGALNGWFGGGAKIPEDTMTRGLVGYWDFDGGTGPLAADKSNNGNDGMINDGGSGNPVGYWTFDEGTGQTAYDYTGTSSNGTLGTSTTSGVDDPVWTSSGRVGGALSFDGKDDFVKVANGSNFNFGNNNFTLEAWVYYNTAPGSINREYLISHTGADDGGYTLATDNLANGIYFYAYDGGWKAASSTGLSANTWYHFVGVHDGNLKLYVNGVLKDSAVVGTLTNPASNDFFVGRATNLNVSTKYHNGLIDDVRIYNYARDAAQVQRDYRETYKTKFSQGKVGTALQFDGTDDYVEVTDSASLNPTDAITVEAWIKPSSFKSECAIVDKPYTSPTGSPYYQYDFNMTEQKLAVLFSINGNYNGWGTSNNVLTQDIWHHVVATYDGTTVKIYVNGEYKTTTHTVGSDVGPIDTYATNLRIGKEQYGLFNGLIDDVRIYNRALSVEEIRYHYNRGGPVGHWKFDEGNGTTTYDSTDNNNDGQLGGGTTAYVPTWTTGKYGTALQFDGANDYVELGKPSTLSFTGAFTAEAWIKKSADASNQVIVGRYSRGDGWVMRPNSTAKDIGISIYRSDATYESLYTGEVLALNTWYHVVARFIPSGTIKVYVNGVEKASKSTTAAGIYLDSLETTRIGNDYGGYFNGLIDDVRIYNYARTADEIRLDYNAGFGVRFGGSPSEDMTRGLVGYWNFDEQGSSLVFDESGQGNDGMINDGGSGNPVGYWTFDEGTGQTAYDYTGSNNGTLGTTTAVSSDDPQWTSSGKVGGALQFDGVNDYVEVADSATLDITGAITLEAWVKPSVAFDSSIDYCGWVTKYTGVGNGQGYAMFYKAGKIEAWFLPDASPLGYTTNLNANQWYYIVMTYVSGGQTKIYLNGVEKASKSSIVMENYDTNLRMGFLKANVSIVPGTMDDVRIYNYARSAAQIQRDYKETYKTKYTQGAPSPGGGWQGNAFRLDGVDDYVEVPDSDNWNFGKNNWSIEAWVSFNTTDANGGWYQQVVDANNRVLLGYSYTAPSVRELIFYSASGGTALAYYRFNWIPTVGTWYHIIFKREQSNVHLFIDGQEKTWSSIDAAIGSNSLPNLAVALKIGEDPWGHMNGLVDEVRIYNRALSAEEIRFHYNRGGPVAHWKFDEGNGTTTYDSTNNNNDGQLGAGTTAYVPTWTTGKYGTALNFDGVNDYVNAGTGSSLYPSVGTIEFWAINQRGNDDTPAFNIYKDASNWMYVGQSGLTSWNIAFKKAGTWYSASVTNPDTTQWHHWASVFNGTTISLYLDGVLVNGPNAASGIGLDYLSGYSVWIGRWYDSSVYRYFKGPIDDVRIYNYARSAEEIRLDYNEGLAVRFGPTPMSPAGCDLDPAGCVTKGLVGRWNFDEAGGALINDQSSFDNDGMFNDGGSGNPVAYWTFDEGIGNTAYDYTGSNNGPLSNSPTWTSSGKVGGALQFDGVDDYIRVTDSSSLDLTTAGTVEAWIKLSSDLHEQAVIHKRGWGGSFAYGLQVNNDGSGPYFYFWVDDDGSYTFDVGIFTGIVNLNQWYHVVGTWDITVGTKIYLDGTLASSTPTAVSAYNTSDLSIGDDGGSWKSFKGALDDARIYNYARSATQIQRDYKETYKTKYTQGAPNPSASSGQQGTSLSFDGVDDYVDAGSGASLNITDAITVGAWVKLQSSASYQFIASKSNDGANGYELFISSVRPRFSAGDASGNPYFDVYPSNPTLNDGLWHYVVGTFNGSIAIVYVDGVQRGNGAYSGKLSPTTANLFIGTRNTPWGYFNGFIDDVRIYNRALSAEEIRYHYNRGGPVAHWKFDEGNGTTTYDSTNNNNDGALGAGTTVYSPTWTTGKYGSALLLDGANDYISISNSSSVSPTDAVTLEAWIKTNQSAGVEQQMILDKRAGATQYNYRFFLDANNYLNFSFYNGAHIGPEAKAPALQPNTWYHVAATYNRSQTILYVDGLVVNSAAENRAMVADTSSLVIGRQNYTATRFFNGIIDDVRIYNYARTAEQIRQDYNAGLSTYFK